MASLALETSVNEPSHVVECSGTNQYAYTLAKATKTFSKTAWSGKTENDDEEIKTLNKALPENCKKLNISFSAKFGNKLSEFYLGKELEIFASASTNYILSDVFIFWFIYITWLAVKNLKTNEKNEKKNK